MPIPITNPRRVSVVLKDYGKKDGAYQFTKVLKGFLVLRGWELVKESKHYVSLIPPAGVKKPFRFNVDLPTQAQVEELARQFHKEGTLQAVMLGDWPSIYRPAHTYKVRTVRVDPFGDEPDGPERTTESQVAATFRVGYLLFWDAQVTFSDSGVSYYETDSSPVLPESASLFDDLDSDTEPDDSPEPEPVEELTAIEADDTEEAYTPTTEDTRKAVLRSIKARRGQQAFRESLRHRYGDRCQISGCELLDVLEAAHIRPYRGDNDHNPANGLLLRSDLHTLFDLDLIGIEPDTFTVRVHPQANAEYGRHDGEKLLCDGAEPNREALSLRWAEYLKKLPE